MRIFPSVERRASGIPDGVAKLRYLRTASERRRRTVGTAVHGMRIAGVASLLVFSHQITRAKVKPATVHAPPAVLSAPAAPRTVWLVEETGGHRVYSNGLLVRSGYTAEGKPRRYRTFSRDWKTASLASAPMGIVFHTTESLIVAFEPGLNQVLKRTSEAVLEHVRRDRLYNFLIDRFGQVYAIVPEDQCAYHAGHSVWADAGRLYVDLNESFLGVSFEAQTESSFAPSAAQVHAGRLLTEMLRSRYGISDANCVTHAQVSVNPDNMRIGYHTDWASNFPFKDLGLTGGYNVPLPAVQAFGFGYDDHFLAAIGGRPWDGLIAAEEQLIRDAAGRGVTAEQYRKFLQQHYRDLRRQQNERAG